MLDRRGILALVAAGALTACAPPQSAETTAAAEPAAVCTKRDGKVLLQSRDAPGLAGTWTGEYTGQNGFRGSTTMTLTAASADSVNGFFEYRWGSGNYDRAPNSGTTVGTIAKDGSLTFFGGDWQLRLEREGEKLVFRAEEKLGGFPVRLRWKKTSTPLKSEAG